MNNDNKVETAIAGLNCWASCATGYKLSFILVYEMTSSKPTTVAEDEQSSQLNAPPPIL